MNGLTKIKAVIFLVLFFVSCKHASHDFLETLQKEVLDRSKIALKNGKGFSTIKLSSLTGFEWDKFYIFDEYVTQKNINSITGLRWAGPDVPRSQKRFFFISKNKEVNYFDFEPEYFPLFLYTCEATEQYEFTRRDDVFAIFESCDKNGCILAMIPERCIGDFKRLYKK